MKIDWVAPIRRAVPFAPVEPVSPYPKIHEYREHPYAEEYAAYRTSDLAGRFSRLAAKAAAPGEDKPLYELLRKDDPGDMGNYAGYGADKRKTWRIPRQGLMYDAYG